MKASGTPRCSRLAGRRPELGVPTRDEWLEAIVHPDDRPMMRQARRRLAGLAAGQARAAVPRHLASGEVRWLVNRARRVMRKRPRHDLRRHARRDRRVRTEAALRSANERVALTARSVGLGTWEWEPTTDTSSWDDQMYRLRGLELSAAPPDAPLRRENGAPRRPRPQWTACCADAVRHHHSAAYEFRWCGRRVGALARSRSTPVDGADGTHYIGVNWDITEGVNAERRGARSSSRNARAKPSRSPRAHESRAAHAPECGARIRAVAAARQRRERSGAARAASNTSCRPASSAVALNDVLDLSSLESGQLKLDMQPCRWRNSSTRRCRSSRRWPTASA